MDASHFPECWERGGDQTRPVMFLVSSPSRLVDLPQMMGLADYSYGFVVKSLTPVLERLGSWRQVVAPESRLVHTAARAIEEGFRPIHLAVSPVHAAYLTPAVPTILFPFWEFPRIPDRDFGWGTRQNWARVARRASLIVTACELTAKAFRQAGVPCPVEVVPVPIADGAFDVPRWSPDYTWRVACRHVSWGGPPADPVEPPMADPCPPPGEHASWKAGVKDRYRRHIKPWLPARAQQWVSRSKRATLQALRRSKPAPVAAAAPDRLSPTPLEVSGLVYTTIFCPTDMRKNPKDLLSAFLHAFKDRPDATLVLKLISRPDSEIRDIGILSDLYLECGVEHKCRVVVIVDYLSDEDLLGLFRATTFYVNTSRAEGACLPLQQALACGRPAIAPTHTAMADYIDDRIGFPVASQPVPTHWPHDPERRIETIWQTLDWSCLRDQYLRSAELVGSRREEYEAMAALARHRMENYASIDAATKAFRRAVDQLGEAPIGALGWGEELAA